MDLDPVESRMKSKDSKRFESLPPGAVANTKDWLPFRYSLRRLRSRWQCSSGRSSLTTEFDDYDVFLAQAAFELLSRFRCDGPDHLGDQPTD
jgi:hypothetical protein